MDEARLTRRQWQALDEVLAEVCERTSGGVEDLHDRGVGVLESVRPAGWRTPVDVGSAAAVSLWRHVRQVIGALVHLEDAAPDDARAIRTAAGEVAALAEHLRTFSHRTSV